MIHRHQLNYAFSEGKYKYICKYIYINDSIVHSWCMNIPSASIYKHIHTEKCTHSNTDGSYGVTFQYPQGTTILTKRYSQNYSNSGYRLNNLQFLHSLSEKSALN